MKISIVILFLGGIVSCSTSHNDTQFTSSAARQGLLPTSSKEKGARACTNVTFGGFSSYSAGNAKGIGGLHLNGINLRTETESKQAWDEVVKADDKYFQLRETLPELKTAWKAIDGYFERVDEAAEGSELRQIWENYIRGRSDKPVELIKLEEAYNEVLNKYPEAVQALDNRSRAIDKYNRIVKEIASKHTDSLC